MREGWPDRPLPRPVLALPPLEVLLGAALAGDHGALRSVAIELLPRVRNLVRYLVRGDARTDDIAQEALLAIVRGLPNFRGEGSLTAWADRITTRVVFACLRRNRQGALHVDAGADLTLVPDPEGLPDEYAARRRAVELLDRLPDPQRQAIVMHHLLGLSISEVALELDVPFETVRSRLRIGLAKLRQLHGLAGGFAP